MVGINGQAVYASADQWHQAGPRALHADVGSDRDPGLRPGAADHGQRPAHDHPQAGVVGAGSRLRVGGERAPDHLGRGQRRLRVGHGDLPCGHADGRGRPTTSSSRRSRRATTRRQRFARAPTSGSRQASPSPTASPRRRPTAPPGRWSTPHPGCRCSSTSASHGGRHATEPHRLSSPSGPPDPRGPTPGPADQFAPGVVLSAPQGCTRGRSGLPLRPTAPGTITPCSRWRRLGILPLGVIGTVGPRSDVPRTSTPVARRGRKATELPESAGLPNGDTIA